MNQLNPKVDHYLIEGCGRCPLVGTPDCKVNTWREELTRLRAILLDCDLTEALKWSYPCYTFENNNVVLLSAFKAYCALTFFKGALLKDANGILDRQGEHSEAARLIRFTSVAEVEVLEPVIKAYVREAIDVEKAGLQVTYKTPAEFAIPEELQMAFEVSPALKTAFAALTPGRQKGYLLYFAAPKQAKTRAARVEKCRQQILDGKGLYDDGY